MLDLKALLLKLVQHYNTIGIIGTTTDSKTGVSLSNSNNWQSFGVNETVGPGTWLITADMRFGSKANNSYRSARIHAGDTYHAITHYQAGSGETGIALIAVVTKTENWTLDFEGRQYSSSSTTAITCSCYWKVMQLK